MGLLGVVGYVSTENSVRRNFEATEEYVYKGDGSGGVVCRTADLRAAADALASLAAEMERVAQKTVGEITVGGRRYKLATRHGEWHVLLHQEEGINHGWKRSAYDLPLVHGLLTVAYDAGKAARDE